MGESTNRAMRDGIIALALLLSLASCGTPTPTDGDPPYGEWRYVVHELEEQWEWSDAYSREIFTGFTDTTHKVKQDEFWGTAPNEGYLKRDGRGLHLYIGAQDSRKGTGLVCGEWTYVLYSYEQVSRMKVTTHERTVGHDEFWRGMSDGYFSREGCTLRGLVS